jgi:hypothetical protein
MLVSTAHPSGTSLEHRPPCLLLPIGMEHPLWMLVPWTVFAVAVGIKFWRITSLFRRHVLPRPTTTEQLRASLERIWARNS